mmetsp:Transcript_574/g.962  ORF Transcript_574/g.962 Transcript_574/m.962 type:complete len:98 (-) Transcript_574:180-473(-)
MELNPGRTAPVPIFEGQEDSTRRDRPVSARVDTAATIAMNRARETKRSCRDVVIVISEEGTEKTAGLRKPGRNLYVEKIRLILDFLGTPSQSCFSSL